MTEDERETKQLNAGFMIVFLIWGAIFASLGVYLFVCLFVGRSLNIEPNPGIPVQALKYALYGISFATLFLAYILRKILLKPGRPSTRSKSLPGQHPAVAKYTLAVMITSALLESIGIYGLVLFFLAKETMALYQLITISALGMIYFRPRKDELFSLAENMKE